MGGDIETESREGQGSTFVLRIPDCLSPGVPALPAAGAGALVALVGLPESEAGPLAAGLQAQGARVERRPAAGAFQTPADLAVLDSEVLAQEAPRAAALAALAGGQRLAVAAPPRGGPILPAALREQVSFLARPLRARQVLAARAGPIDAPGQAAEDAPGLVDWGRLATRYPGKQDFVDKLAALVLTSQGEQPASLRAHAQGGDYAQVAAIAHAIKGSAGNLMADTVQDLAARTERAARGCAPEARMLAEGLAQALEAMLAQIRARMERRADRTG